MEPNGRAVVQIFYNPATGSYSPRRIDALAAALAGQGARVLRSPSIDSIPELAQGVTHVCIAGGDGTIRHVAQMLWRAGAALPVGVYPVGTINLIAREGGKSRSPARFARELLGTGPARAHYLCHLGETMFLACASVGPDSLSVAALSPALKRWIGRAAYAAAFLKVLRHWPRPRLTLRNDGQVHACEAVYVAKGRFFAGPWSFAPAARVSDGLLHVLALKQARRRDFALLALDMLLGRDPALRANATSFTCTELEIDAAAPLPVQADGDIVAHCPVRLAIDPVPLGFR